jgi:hypothetical protein
MTSKKQIKTNNTKSTPWKHRRELLSKSIPLEVDLESRQLFFNTNVDKNLNLNFNTDNLDKLIESHLHPKESKKVIKSLSRAEKGLEKPILFNFVHPLTSKAFQFEYHYKIVYVNYSTTRLQGELKKSLSKNLKKK